MRNRGRALFRPTLPINGEEDKCFQEFIRVNSAFWNSRTASVPERRGEHILVEGLSNHPLYLLLNALIAGYLARETGLPMVALLASRTDRKNIRFFESYGVREFVFLSDRKSRVLDMLRCGVLATRSLRGGGGGDDLLAIELDGIDFGRLAYSQAIRSTGNGTIENLSPPIFEMLVDALCYRCYFDRLFEQHRFPILVQSQADVSRWSILAQVALKHGAAVYSRLGGPTRISVRRYDDLHQIHISKYRPTQELFEYVYEHYRKEAIAAADAHMQRRFSGSMTINEAMDAQLPFSKDRRIASKEELCREFGWSVEKPTVCILPHIFIEDLHSTAWELFPDYLTWFRYTLQAIRKIDHVNWLVKSHPSEINYRESRQTAQGEYESLAADCEHVQFMPKDVNTSSLLDIAHAILTVRGTPGLEFACFGIPCVLASEAPYSGFGFTVEPQSREEYLALLKNIHTLEPLSGLQVERAKVAAYIYLELCRVESKLIPNFSPYADVDEDTGWRDAANRVREYDPFDGRLYQMLQIQIKQKYRHLLNYDWIGWS